MSWIRRSFCSVSDFHPWIIVQDRQDEVHLGSISGRTSLHLLLLFLAIANIVFFIWQNRERYLRPFDYKYFGKLYSESQYIKGELSKGGIGDDGLYAFAGYYYITGGDVSQVNFEHPPLGKYLIGLSAILFGNELVVNIVYAVALLAIVYFLGLLFTKDKTSSALAALVVSADPLVTTNFAISLLDLPMTVFFLAGLYTFILGTKRDNPVSLFFLSAFLFSLSFVMRFFPFLPFLLCILTLGLIKKGVNYWRPFLVFWIILLPLVYLLSYASYFYYHPSMIEFWRYHKWIIAWRLSNPVVLGNIITTLLVGRYRSWWESGGWLTASDWSILTPLIVILGLVGMWRQWRRKFPHWLVALMVAIFLIYVAVGTVGVAKFVLPIYPILVIAASQGLIIQSRSLAKRYGRA